MALRRVLPALLLGCCLFPGCRLIAADDGFAPIDLGAAEWYATREFAPPEEMPLAESVRVGGTPIRLNDIFQRPASNEIGRYSLAVRFELKTMPEQNLGLYLAWIGEGWRVYLNGRLIRNELHLDAAQRQLLRYRNYRGVHIALPAAALRPGQNTLVFHVAGYTGPVDALSNGDVGLLYESPYLIDSEGALHARFNDYLALALHAVYFFFGLYHIVFYLRRTTDSYNLFFGLMCVSLAIDGFSKTLLIHNLVPDTALVTRLKYAAQATMIPAFALFHRSYLFADEKRNLADRILISIGLLFVGAFLLGPVRWLEPGLLAFHITLLPAMAYGVGVIGRALVKRRPDALWILLAFLTLMSGVLWDIVDDHYMATGFRLLTWTFLAYVLLLVVMLANRFLFIHNESERLNVELARQRDSFFRFVPTEFLHFLGRHSLIEIRPGDSCIQNMTVMFLDIRAFTSLSESMDVAENFHFLNSFLSRMEPIIKEHGGFVDKYVGDAILALFADSERGSSATLATQAAQRMLAELDAFNADRRSADLPPVRIGIGLNSGRLMLGTVGSQNRLDTTVIGDTVNAAARVEQMNKQYNSNILLTEECYTLLDSAEQARCRPVDLATLRGRSAPVTIFECFGGDGADLLEQKAATRDALFAALESFLNGDFAACLAKLAALAGRMPGEGIAQQMRARCEFAVASDQKAG